MHADTLIHNALVPCGDAAVPAQILITNGMIAGVVAPAVNVTASTTINAHACLVLPGCIDSHVHFMDPGFTHRETFAHGTRAAAAGGVTTVIDMPCCSTPSVRDCASLENKINAIAPQAYVDFALWGGATGEDVRLGLLDNVAKQAAAGVVGFKAYMTPSVPSYPRSDDAELLEIFTDVAQTGLPLGLHTENFIVCDHFVKKLQAQGRTDPQAWEEARMVLAEKVAIELCIAFAEHTGARMHVVHLSSNTGAELIRAAKRRGLPVTGETCPHYLTLDGPSIMDQCGSFAKIAPPIRCIAEGDPLWHKLASGVLDFVATDHAPYDITTEKRAPGMNIWTSFPGMPGVETMVPVIISEGYLKGRLSLSRVVDVLSRNAAIHYGLYPKKGSMHIGSDADLTFIDLTQSWKVDAPSMQSKCGYSPFDGMTLTGKVVRTMVRGTSVFEGHTVCGQPGYGLFVPRQNISRLPLTLNCAPTDLGC